MKKTNYIVITISLAVIVFAVMSYEPTAPSITGFAQLQTGNLTVGIDTYISCAMSDAASNVSFGTDLSPGTNDTNATMNYIVTGNGTNYSIAVSVLNTVNTNISIKGVNLTYAANVLGIGNITWQSNSTDVNGTNMVPSGSNLVQETYDTTNWIASDLPDSVENTTYIRFWIDIPDGQVAGTYTGNYTLYCQQT